DVDTSFFMGNYPESCAIDACDARGNSSPEDLSRAAWREILARHPLRGDTHNLIAIDAAPPATHLRLRICPDGGVARLRAHGEVDTRHFKGNAPGACGLEASGGETAAVLGERAAWRELLPRMPLQPHTRHWFEEELNAVGDATHVRFNIYPDGGVARLRLFGR